MVNIVVAMVIFGVGVGLWALIGPRPPGEPSEQERAQLNERFKPAPKRWPWQH
jgi:hypothetical protein